jgi:glycosyltransferase involved in cell wall biosynthesis
VASLVRAVRARLSAVIVVDDGSEDDTAALARAAGAQVVRHPGNLGKGAALRTGLSAALGQGLEWAFTLDGDGQHRPDDMPVFLQCAERTDAALVVGNRLHQPQAIPWLRREVNRWMSRQLSRRAGRPLPDTQCGYRLMSLKAWAALRLTTRHFEVESETLLAFLAAGHRVEFVPIQVVGRTAQSHIRPFRDAWRWCRWWFRSKPGPGETGPGR